MRCRGTNRDGTPCRAPERLVGADGWCRSHRPGAREVLVEQGRRGAEATARKLRGGGLDPADLPPLDGPQAAARWLHVVALGVATNRIGHREATAVVRSIEVFLRAHDQGELKAEIDALRDALAEWRRTGDANALVRAANQEKTGMR